MRGSVPCVCSLLKELVFTGNSVQTVWKKMYFVITWNRKGNSVEMQMKNEITETKYMKFANLS